MDAPIEAAGEMLRHKIAARRDILLQIKEELIERLQLDYSPDDIDDDTFLFGTGLALDSIDAMEIVIGMQARFGVLMPDGDIASLRTINTLADFVMAEQALEETNA
jgi:acyl carrier protein